MFIDHQNRPDTLTQSFALGDPRISHDPLVLRAITIWDQVSASRDHARTSAEQLLEELGGVDNHRAIAWATATCGRVAAYCEKVDVAETLLTDALGRFYLIGDTYGRAVVTSHLAIPQALRGNVRRSRELALEPFRLETQFDPRDLALMHCVAAMSYQECGEFHAAIFHLNSEYEIVTNSRQSERIPVVVGNIAAMLITVGEFELALEAATQAWQLEQESSSHSGQQPSVAHLANMVSANIHLDRLDAVRRDVETLIEHISPTVDIGGSPVLYDIVAFACARTGKLKLARDFLTRYQSSAAGHRSLSRRAMARCTETVLLEAEDHLDEAIKLAESVFLQTAPRFSLTTYLDMTDVLVRCHKRKGNKAEADRWMRHKTEVQQKSVLNDVLSNQVRSNLRVKEPAIQFTDHELSCLRLSANGQTSSDIGLKLGIKPRTVNFHFSKILRKLNAMNRQEAIAKAISAKIIQ
jgi:DNA-binding CsgD family transcriptional regulator